MKLQMPKGCDSVTHGSEGWTPSNLSWIVELPDEIGRFMLEDGRSGAILIDEPGHDAITCPHCGRSFPKE